MTRKRSVAPSPVIRTSLVLSLVLFAAPALSGCSDGQKHADAAPPATTADAQAAPATEQPAAPVSFGVGQPAPGFTLARVGGGEVSLEQFRGKAVLVDFWATWCPPCRRAMPHFQELSQTYKDDLVVIAVSLDQEPESVVPAYVEKNGLTFHVTADPRAMEVAQVWGGVRSIPTTYLVDRQGKVVQMWMGANPKEVYEVDVRKAIGKS